MRFLSHALLVIAFVAAAVWFGKWMMDRVRGDRVSDPTPEQRVEMERLAQPVPEPSAKRLPAALPLDLSLPWRVYGDGLGWLGWIAVALLWLLFGMEAWWARILGGVGALVVLAVLAMQLGELRDLWRERLVVAADGLEHRRGEQILHRLAWREIGGVRLVPQTTRYWKGGSLNSRTTSITGWMLSFDAPDGSELFAIPAPLRPAEDYQALLDALPVWTGKPVLREKPKPP